MAFVMAHWRAILLVYAVIGGLVFLGGPPFLCLGLLHG